MRTKTGPTLASTESKELFDHPTIEIASDRKDEERTAAYGYLHGHPLVVVYTERGDRYRLISARLATQHEEQELMRKLGIERRKQRKDRERKDQSGDKSKGRDYE